MQIDLPTMVLLNIAASATLALSLGWVARRQDKDGLHRWTWALILYTIALVLPALRTTSADFVSILVANVALAGTLALFLAATAQLLERRLAPILLWGPPLLLAGAEGFLMTDPTDPTGRVIVSALIFSAQLLLPMWLLASSGNAVNGRGKHLMLFGFAIMIATHLGRLIGAAPGTGVVTDIMQETPLRSLVVLSTFVTLILVSFGFVLMVKERADERIRRVAMPDRLTGTHDPRRRDEVTDGVGIAACREGATLGSWRNRAGQSLDPAEAAGRNRVATESDAPPAAVADARGCNFVALIWSPAYESGNAQIDDQHRALFEHSNRLLRAILNNFSEQEIAQLISALVEKIQQHFMDEEALLHALGYAQSEPHRQLHQRLLASAEPLVDRFAQGQLGVGELFQYIANDLVARHILIEDRKYFPLLAP